MTRSKRIAIAALAAATVAAPAVAMADYNSPAATTTPSVQLKGAYAFVDHFAPESKTYAAVVFKTKNALPRRFDGMIRAGGSLDGLNNSVGSTGRYKSHNCYQIFVPIKDGKIRGHSDRRGTTHMLEVSARGTNGDVSDTTTVKLRSKRPGDRAGKPLGC